MKIGIDIRCLIGGKRTGVEEYTLELLEHLFAEDRENEYVLFWNAWKLPRCPRDWNRRFPNVHLVSFRIPNKLLNFSLWYFGFPKLDRLLGGVDVFFLPNLNFAAFSRQVKIVLTVHDLSFLLSPETFSWKRRLWHALVNFRRLVRRANRILAVSESTRDDLLRFLGISPRKISLVLSGISERFCRMNRNDPALIDVRSRYRLPYRFILSLGTIEPRKNLKTLILAFDRLVQDGEAADFHLVLAGGVGWNESSIFDSIRKLPSRSRIRFLGFIQDREKPALYNLSTIFVFPSTYEGFGFPPLEAAACGVPTMVSDTSSLPEIADGSAILVDPLRPEEFVSALREILCDRVLRENLSKLGENSSRRFSWKKAARNTVKVFWEMKRK